MEVYNLTAHDYGSLRPHNSNLTQLQHFIINILLLLLRLRCFHNSTTYVRIVITGDHEAYNYFCML